MNAELQEKLEELNKKIIDALDVVARVAEAEIKKPPDIINANKVVAAVVSYYKDIRKKIPKEDKDQVERSFGRRVMDMRRLGSKLPALRHGKAIPTATADPFGAGLPFSKEKTILRPINDPFDIVPPKRPPEQTGFAVGKDVESWCGPCNDMVDHTVVAMVDGYPKQVISHLLRGKARLPHRALQAQEEGGGGHLHRPPQVLPGTGGLQAQGRREVLLAKGALRGRERAALQQAREVQGRADHRARNPRPRQD